MFHFYPREVSSPLNRNGGRVDVGDRGRLEGEEIEEWKVEKQQSGYKKINKIKNVTQSLS